MLPKSLNIINNLPWRLDFCLHFFWNFKTAYFSFHKTVNQRHCSQCSVGLKIGLFTSCCSCEMILVDPYLYYIGGLGALWEVIKWELYVMALWHRFSSLLVSTVEKQKFQAGEHFCSPTWTRSPEPFFLSRTIRIILEPFFFSGRKSAWFFRIMDHKKTVPDPGFGIIL